MFLTTFDGSSNSLVGISCFFKLILQNSTLNVFACFGNNQQSKCHSHNDHLGFYKIVIFIVIHLLMEEMSELNHLQSAAIPEIQVHSESERNRKTVHFIN